MTKKKILDRDLRSIFDPRTWLLIVLVPHTLFGALYPLVNAELYSEEWKDATFGLLIAVVILSIYLFTQGRALARMTAVTAGSVFMWIIIMSLATEGEGFVLSAELSPPFIYKFSFSIELAPPLLLWGILFLTGIIHWNSRLTNSDNNQSDELDEIISKSKKNLAKIVSDEEN